MKWVLLVALLVLTSCDRRPPERWEFPDGYKGWVVVSYGRSECQPLPRQDGWLIYRIPTDGQLCTSDEVPQGTAEDRYEYVSPDGTRKPLSYLRDVRVLTYEAVSRKLLLFVGTQQEQDSAETSKPPPFR